MDKSIDEMGEDLVRRAFCKNTNSLIDPAQTHNKSITQSFFEEFLESSPE